MSRRNEPGARSEAECSPTSAHEYDCNTDQSVHDAHACDYYDGGPCDHACRSDDHLPKEGGDGGSSPSFLVLSKDNVNGYLWRAEGLRAMWDFLEHKGRVGRTQVLLLHKDDLRNVLIFPASARCRYFQAGRLRMSRNIEERLGKYENVPGLMQTLTYDPKRTGKQEAWAGFGGDTRRFINAVNQYRRRRGWRRLHYLWVVEVQEGTGYPHVHIFFPRLKWLAPVSVLTSNWPHGRSNIETPKKITTNCAAYVSKYLRKMHGWSDLHLALLWSGRCRMYGFSRGFSAKAAPKPESKFERWCVIETDNVRALESNLLHEGYMLDGDGKIDEDAW